MGASCRQLLSAHAQIVAERIEEDYVWLADSGATHHMTSHREWFTQYESISKNSLSITIGDSTMLYAAGRGQVAVDVMIDGRKIRYTLSNVLHVPGIKRNLFSIGAATDLGVEAKLGQRELKLFRNGALIATGRHKGNELYCMNIRVSSTTEANFNSAKPASLQTWHERIGHANYRMVCELADGEAVTGMVCNDKTLSIHLATTASVRLVYSASNVDHRSRRTQSVRQHQVKRHGLTLWVQCRLTLDGSRFLAQFVDDCTGVVTDTIEE